MDVVVTRTDDASAWTLTDLLGRSMGRVTEDQSQQFRIEPEGHAIETMSGLQFGPHPTLDAALSKIERHTRGVCSRAPEEQE